MKSTKGNFALLAVLSIGISATAARHVGRWELIQPVHGMALRDGQVKGSPAAGHANTAGRGASGGGNGPRQLHQATQAPKQHVHLRRSSLALPPDDGGPTHTHPYTHGYTAAQSDQLHRQAATAASLAELLFASAQPLAKLPGSTVALLPYLNPTVLRLYLSQPNRRATDLAAEMYDIAQDLAYDGGGQRGALYRALYDTITWVAASRLTRLQHVPDLPWADVAWPVETTEPHDLESIINRALLNSDQLGSVGDTVEAATDGRLTRSAFAALVPRLSKVLATLHLDLAYVMNMARVHYKANWAPQDKAKVAVGAAAAAGGGGVGGGSSSSRRRRLRHAGPHSDEGGGWEDGFLADRFASNLDYAMPPKDFVPRPASERPQLLVPLVFHVFSYDDSSTGDVGPRGYDNPGLVERWVRMANIRATPTQVQFFIQEIRSDAGVHPYLRFPSREAWAGCYETSDGPCLTHEFATSAMVGYPRVINVHVAGEPAAVDGLAGYTRNVPGSDSMPELGFVWIAWDNALPGPNSQAGFEEGSLTLLHELFHFLGLDHTWGGSAAEHSCDTDDGVHDTPVSYSEAIAGSFAVTGAALCSHLFYDKYGGDWEKLYNRWSTQLGIPEEDQNAWADSCPNQPGYDELGNYMTYNVAVCFAVMGHFTEGQVTRVHELASQLNPVMYAWGQYYAQTMPARPPSPPLPAEPPGPDPCKHTLVGCRCNAHWTHPEDGTPRSYCDTWQGKQLLECEVEDRDSCYTCTAANATQPCYGFCLGTPLLCGKAGVVDLPAVQPRQPPFPTAPPPPPPDVPDDIPPECKVTWSGCPCRATWGFSGSVPMHYCDYHEAAGSFLFCAVDPSCPTFDESAPLVHCARNLTLDHCCRRQPPLQPQPAPKPPPPPLPPPECREVNATCGCLDTWTLGGETFHYCDSPDGDDELWCEADPYSCANYPGILQRYIRCDASLTKEYCQGTGGGGQYGGGYYGGYYGGYHGGYGGYGYGGRSPGAYSSSRR